jgi:hypothetical protein
MCPEQTLPQIPTQFECLHEMVAYAENKHIDKIPLSVVKGVLEAPTDQVRDKWKKQITDHKVVG